MLVKNSKSIELLKAVTAITSEKQLMEKSIVWLRNRRLLNTVVDEYNEIIKSISTTFSEENNLDESRYNSDSEYKVEMDKLFDEYYKTKIVDVDKFLNEEKDLTFTTFPESDLEGKEFNIDAIDYITGYIVII